MNGIYRPQLIKVCTRKIEYSCKFQEKKIITFWGMPSHSGLHSKSDALTYTERTLLGKSK